MEQRDQPVAYVQNYRVPHPVRALRQLRLRNADQLAYVHLRNGIALPTVRHQQRRNDGQRQRQLDAKSGAPARRRIDLDLSPQPFEVGLHYVHAHAAPRYVADFLGRRDSRQENQRQFLGLSHVLRLFARD
jgi:hypothetical protein